MESAKRSAKWAAILFVLGVLPLVISAGCAGLANTLNCALGSEARPCLLGGVNIGGALHTGFNLAWLSNISIWLVPVAIAVAMVAVIHFIRARGGAKDPGI